MARRGSYEIGDGTRRLGGKLFLHIGRNRAGSTTLQNAWLRHFDALRAGGVEYVLFGQKSPPDRAIVSFSSHMALAQYIRDHSSSSVLVSHEGLCCFQQEFAAAMASDLSKLDVTLVAYVRPYRDWVVSDYVFNVLIGEQSEDFDSYLEHLGGRVAFWPSLRIWGDAIGWNRVRVRSLHPDDLTGGDLIVDGMAAIGLPHRAGGPAPRENASPAWISTELIRFLLAGSTDSRRPSDRHEIAEILRMGELIDYEVRLAAGYEGLSLESGSYLTAKQAESLAILYNADLALIAAYTGWTLRHDEGAGDFAREFIPSASHIPHRILSSIQESIHSKRLLGLIKEVVGEHRAKTFMELGRNGL